LATALNVLSRAEEVLEKNTPGRQTCFKKAMRGKTATAGTLGINQKVKKTKNRPRVGGAKIILRGIFNNQISRKSPKSGYGQPGRGHQVEIVSSP